ncbi:hypothetical protein LSH36_333g01004 [Paralvinella palmiformis]|uniref:MYND-type domain-containing protein n=1 Tax=Paralvinella palmiformis TaxID=53620 RepID=A0AAD9JG54_9ANNE|nr:hypothetical protein LSH36_333g01004 [Paralvinella palmiformis]
MRKIVLSPHDLEMFATDMTRIELEFIEKHWKPFRQMWNEQGRKFWIQFLAVYRMSATEYGVIKDLVNMKDSFQSLIDELFIFMHENFIDGNFGSAKKCIDDIITVVINKDKFRFLQSKSFAKDPFYNKETRDSFRHLFGSPKLKVSYIKVCALHEIYTVFGSAVITCLKRWLVADELPPGVEDTWQPIISIKQLKPETRPKQQVICAYCHQVDDDRVPITWHSSLETFVLEKLRGQPCGPWFVAGWKRHEDPRFHDTKNPLYDLIENPDSDWRQNLNFYKFLDFHEYVSKKYLPQHAEDDKMYQNMDFSAEDVQEILRTVDKFAIDMTGNEAKQESHLSSANTRRAHTETGVRQKSKATNPKAKDDYENTILHESLIVQESEPVLAFEDGMLCLQSRIEVKSTRTLIDFTPFSEDKSEPDRCVSFEKDDPDDEIGGFVERSSSCRRAFNDGNQNHLRMPKKCWYLSFLDLVLIMIVYFTGQENNESSSVAMNSVPKWTPKKCSQCEKHETLPKTFKMCQLCKEIHLKSAKYYCSRDCQMKDWKAKHKLEHKHNLLK